MWPLSPFSLRRASVPCNNHKQLSQPPSSKAEETTGQTPSFVFCFPDEALFEMNCGILLLTNDELVIGGVQSINLGYLSNPPA